MSRSLYIYLMWTLVRSFLPGAVDLRIMYIVIMVYSNRWIFGSFLSNLLQSSILTEYTCSTANQEIEYAKFIHFRITFVFDQSISHSVAFTIWEFEFC